MTLSTQDFAERVNAPDARQELANTLTHAPGLVLSLAGTVWLVGRAAAGGDAWVTVSCAIYGATLVAFYAASTFYHAVQGPRPKAALRKADHVCIYLLIAGTYTPFALTALRGPWGWSLMGVEWGLVAVGLVNKLFLMDRFRRMSVGLYLAMGWVGIVAAKPVVERLPGGCVLLMATGGLIYTAGVYFYAQPRIPYHHTIWHGFVLAASAMHFVAIAVYVA